MPQRGLVGYEDNGEQRIDFNGRFIEVHKAHKYRVAFVPSNSKDTLIRVIFVVFVAFVPERDAVACHFPVLNAPVLLITVLLE